MTTSKKCKIDLTSIRSLAQTNSKKPVPEEDHTSQLTVMISSNGSMRKEFFIGVSGELESVPYANAYLFMHSQVAVSNISQLSETLQNLSKSPKTMIIRGEPIPGLDQAVPRNKLNFPEPIRGCHWVMLDFDNVEPPAGCNPISPAAIESLVQKLPVCFRDVSYFYQFSSSAGIVKPDGSSLKSGINAHIFFWLDRPVTGDILNAFLKLHCIQSQFYSRVLNKGGYPAIRYGFDEAVLRAVQPHYIASPKIGTGVRCDLLEAHRQGLITKARSSVALPEIDNSTQIESDSLHYKITSDWKVANGYKYKTSITRISGGAIGVEKYLSRTGTTGSTSGRPFVEAKLNQVQNSDGTTRQVVTLYFSDEKTPGGWYVCDHSPHLARHYGGEVVPLQELSADAHAYVRDKLRWIEDISHSTLSLSQNGYLPDLDAVITARATLLLAPTGSGKSTALCNYALTNKQKIIIYAAPTIALTRQMCQDLRNKHVAVTHYDDFGVGNPLTPGVYVTTNQSLRKFEKSWLEGGIDFTLVIDEVHAAIDEFMRSETMNRLFERVLSRSNRVLLMTGTITELQTKKVVDSISRALCSLTATTFQSIEFTSNKANPLYWAEERNFGKDIVALMRSHQALKARGQPLPRVVLIMPTSSMRRFELLLEQFGLTGDAVVVSRDEATAAEIEEARVSEKPWLISSPLFALGLNFEHPPQRLWTSFGRLDVDTSQVIQTLNRANRSGLPCEVRLYAGKLDASPIIPANHTVRRTEIESYLVDETGVLGSIDPYFHLDRATYVSLRNEYEKNTAKALYKLKGEDSIQNYRICEQWSDDIRATGDDEEMFKVAGKTAIASYNNDVLTLHADYSGGSTPVLLAQLLKERQSGKNFRTANKLPKENKDTQNAITAAICASEDLAKKNNKAKPETLLRLHAEMRPFLSEQYSAADPSASQKASAEKTREIIKITYLLEDLRDGKLNGMSFGKKMRLQEARRGVLALAHNLEDLSELNRKLKELDKLFELEPKLSSDTRIGLKYKYFKAAMGFLERFGIRFEKSRGSDGRWRLDPTKPVVPATWDFQSMRLALEIAAESRLHSSATDFDREQEAQKWDGVAVSAETCRTCAHCNLYEVCAVGRPIDFHQDGIDPVQMECDAYAGLPNRVKMMKVNFAAPRNPEISWRPKVADPQVCLAISDAADFHIYSRKNSIESIQCEIDIS